MSLFFGFLSAHDVIRNERKKFQSEPETKECDSWVYDNSTYSSTIVSEVNFVIISFLELLN